MMHFSVTALDLDTG